MLEFLSIGVYRLNSMPDHINVATKIKIVEALIIDLLFCGDCVPALRVNFKNKATKMPVTNIFVHKNMTILISNALNDS